MTAPRISTPVQLDSPTAHTSADAVAIRNKRGVGSGMDRLWEGFLIGNDAQLCRQARVASQRRWLVIATQVPHRSWPCSKFLDYILSDFCWASCGITVVSPSCHVDGWKANVRIIFSFDKTEYCGLRAGEGYSAVEIGTTSVT